MRSSREEELEDEVEVLKQQLSAFRPSDKELGVLMALRHGMTQRTAEILHILIKRAPATVSKATLHSLIYGSLDDGGPEPRIFAVYITRIRKTLERLKIPGKIEAVWNSGWRASPDLVEWVQDLYKREIPQEKKS